MTFNIYLDRLVYEFNVVCCSTPHSYCHNTYAILRAIGLCHPFCIGFQNRTHSCNW